MFLRRGLGGRFFRIQRVGSNMLITFIFIFSEIRFVVFGDEIDYRSHMREVHGVRGQEKIHVGFKVLR